MRKDGIGRRRRFAALVGLSLLAAGGLALATVGGASGAGANASTTLKVFQTPGTYSWTVPSGVTKVTFDVFGASGGSVAQTLPGPIISLVSQGGAGGEARATVRVTPGETFELTIGGRGGTVVDSTAGGSGGFNGGGPGNVSNSGGLGGGGGGGASDVRIGGRGNPCAGAKTCSFYDRIVAAGGGGGGGGQGRDGGAGGGVTGAASFQDDGVGGTQERAGDLGGFGYGGPGDGNNTGGGGGGGGWFGGGSGSQSGGGGGSGFVSHVAAAGSFPGLTRIGDGRVVIRTP